MSRGPEANDPATEATPQRSNLARSVVSLGLTQIVGFGTIYYAFGVMVVPLSADLGLTPTLAYGLLSLALLAGALSAPLAGALIDRHGARRVMAAGSAASALGFVALSQARDAWTLGAALLAIELIAPLVLYDAAFAGVARAVGPRRARRAITYVTLLGGFASTVFWPLTLLLMEQGGWRFACLVFAGLHLCLCLPLHLLLPRSGPEDSAKAAAEPPEFAPLPARLHPRAMGLLAFGLAMSWAMMSAFSAQWVPVMAAVGLPEASAVAAGALMGPAQVVARVAEMRFARHSHPMITALVAMGCLVVAVLVLLLAPVGLVSAGVFALLFGAGQGLATMVRGTVPLALFGLQGYAARLGKLASLRSLVAALSPFGMAASMASFGPWVTLAGAAALALAALGILARVPWRIRA